MEGTPVSKTVVQSPFRVMSAGPWEPEAFGVVQVKVTKTDEGLRASLRERDGSPPITFLVDGVETRGDVLVLRTKSVRKWIFQALN